jgi:transposase
MAILLELYRLVLYLLVARGVRPRGADGHSSQSAPHIYTNKGKTDEIHAEDLARLARLDPKLLYPLNHRDEDVQAHLVLIRSRKTLVGSRTQLINHVWGAVESCGARLPKCPARSLHKKVIEHIPEALWLALRPVLEKIGSLTERIRKYDRQLEMVCREHYPETDLLKQVEGLERLPHSPSCSAWRIPVPGY